MRRSSFQLKVKRKKGRKNKKQKEEKGAWNHFNKRKSLGAICIRLCSTNKHSVTGCDDNVLSIFLMGKN